LGAVRRKLFRTLFQLQFIEFARLEQEHIVSIRSRIKRKVKARRNLQSALEYPTQDGHLPPSDSVDPSLPR
jgi:hypothetical protein